MRSCLAGAVLCALVLGALAPPANTEEKPMAESRKIDGGLFPATGSELDSIQHETTVSIAPAAAFAKWSSSEGLKSWLGVDSKIELRIGGAYEWYFLPPTAPERGGEGCQILSYLPGEMLSFSWNAPPKLPDERKLRSWVVVRFDKSGEAGTRVTLTHTGFGAGGKWADVKTYFDAAWPNVLAAFKRGTTK